MFNRRKHRDSIKISRDEAEKSLYDSQREQIKREQVNVTSFAAPADQLDQANTAAPAISFRERLMKRRCELEDEVRRKNDEIVDLDAAIAWLGRNPTAEAIFRKLEHYIAERT